MRVFNRALATIIAVVLIAGSAIGILYLIGLLTGTPALTQFVQGWFQAIAQLGIGGIQAILLGILLVSLLLFVLEVRPWRAQFITIRDDDTGRTQVRRADIERYLMQRLSRERAITTDSVDVIVYGDRFDVATSVSASTGADRHQVRDRVEADIKSNLESIGLDKELERMGTRVQRVKRAA
ncbi:MAG: hypothetical protein IBX64_08325 [Actinobacteria bacterium]|nr:hypothetical protein [Actinomycetota bacterium]